MSDFGGVDVSDVDVSDVDVSDVDAIDVVDEEVFNAIDDMEVLVRGNVDEVVEDILDGEIGVIGGTLVDVVVVVIGAVTGIQIDTSRMQVQ